MAEAKKTAAKKSTTKQKAASSKKKSIKRDEPPKVTEEAVMVRVEIDDGVGNVARYSGLFFVFVGAIFSFMSLGDLHTETERYIAAVSSGSGSQYVQVPAEHAGPRGVVMAMEGLLTQGDASSPENNLAAVAAYDSPALSERASMQRVAGPPAYLPQSAQVFEGFPQVFSDNLFVLVSSLGIVMLGLVLLLISLFISRDRKEKHAATFEKPKPPFSVPA